jgi:uncharacterized protein YegL
MAKLTDDKWVTGNTHGFNFSGIKPEQLSATEYTLATIVMDTSGSVMGFEQQLTDCAKAAMDACRRSPRADNLMLRFVTFNTNIKEQHGFLPLKDVPLTAYGLPACGGGTALYDAMYSSVEASNQYAKVLSDQEFGVNAIVFVITDGDEYDSKTTASIVKKAISEGVEAEYLESLATVLIGVNATTLANKLDAIKTACGLSQFVDAGQADEKNLAKLASFISRSISSQSQALGSGGPSQPLVF